MDGSSWKRVLLHWVNQTRFFQRTFYNLEQTDIEEFFDKFRDNITSYPVEQNNLILFLRDQYPEFEPHLDDDNHLSSVEYMYVYSLLLHYSCVKCPEEHFHKICRNLHENFQQAIATFFNELLNKEAISKTNLRQAIASADPKAIISISSLDSPIKTPRTFKISPPTPKTNMLEEKTRELNLLKAQLETERYDKGLLEVQLKQYEEKIEKLANLQKRNSAEIHELKNELLALSTENNSASKDIMDENIKKSLRKEIAEKEEVILGLRENLESVEEERILLTEKLSYSERQVITCLEKIKEMDHTVNELKTEMEQMNVTIQVLTETKNDLEQFIAETRSSPGYRQDLNMSAECLDTSLSRTTNSSGSLSSPENLGCSVIDIQLKEKEFENAKLREEIQNMKCDQSKLSKHVFELIARHADVFEICNENLLATEDGTLTESFMVFENYVESLMEKYKLSSKNVKHLTDEAKLFRSENKDLSKRLSDVEEAMLNFQNQVIMLQKEKDSLEKESKEMQSKFEVYIHDIEELTNERKDLLDTITTLKKEHDKLKVQKQLSEQELMEKVKNLSSDVMKKCSQIDNLELQSEALSSKVTELLENVSNLEENLARSNDLENLIKSENANLENEILNLKAELTDLNNKLKHQKEEEGALRENYNCLAQVHEQLKLSSEEIKARLEKMENNYKIEIDKNKTLKEELSDLNIKNSELVSKINDLVVTNTSLEENHLKIQGEISALKADISKKDGRIYELDNKLANLESEKEVLVFKYEENNCANSLVIEKLRNNLEDCKNQFDEASNKFKNSLENVQKENDTLYKTITDKDAQYKELSIIVDTLRSEKYSLEENITQIKEKLQKKIDLLNDSNESMIKGLQILLEKLEEYVGEENCSDPVSFLDQEFSDSIMNELRNKLNKLLNNNCELNRKNLDLSSKVSKLESKIEEVTNTKDKLIQKLNMSENDIEQLATEIRALESCKHGYMSEIEKLRATLDSVQKDCNNLSDRNVELRSLTTVLEQELQDVIQENINLLCKIGDFEAENELIIRKSNELAAELDISTREHDKLKLSAESTELSLNQEIFILKAKEEASEEEIMSLRKRCEEYSAIINNLESLRDEHLSQKEDMKLLNKSLSDKLIDLQKKHDELVTERFELNEGKTKLVEEKNILQESEKNLKLEIEKLKENKKDLEAKVKRFSDTLSEMTGALECAKSENISLDKKSAMFMLEIKELKKNLEESKQKEQLHKIELEVKSKEFSENINQAHNVTLSLRDAHERLQAETIEMRDKNFKLNAEISNLSNKIGSLQEENERLKNDLADLTNLVQKCQAERDNLEKENFNNLEKLQQLESSQAELINDQTSLKSRYDEKIKELKSLLDEKVSQSSELLDQIEKLESTEKTQANELREKLERIDELKHNLELAENLYRGEKSLNENLNKDISIFKAKLYKHRQITEEKEKKWLEEKNKLISEKKLAEERIKENRLEMEGKLEKMKSKMKSIYNEEVAKIRSKHEREVGELRKELQALLVKNEKYEGHVQKLSRQIYQLNDTILDLQKENKFMETKLKDYESCPSVFRKHHGPSSQLLGSDLRMEDEEGEIFNNTYLTDLKTGRISPFGRDSVSVQELQYRNSLAPPHLRSTYSAQYLDQHVREEDIKDGIPINLDDSLSSLLHAGQRKKMTGTTSYKRPGPPTPSKNAGRLSFGGCIDTYPREILKEANDSAHYGPFKKTTPKKLKSFFTSSKSKDEFSSPQRKISFRKRKSFPRPLGAQFTSTPRKSRVHFDQRRQLDLFLNTSHSDDTISDPMFQKEILCTKVPAEREFEKKVEKFGGWRQSKNYATESESNSSFADKIDKFEFLPKKKNTKERRVSFFYRGNVYNRSRLPSKIIRDQIKSKAKIERNANFNKFRKSLNEVHLRKSLLGITGRPSTDNCCNQIYPSAKDLICSNFIFDANNNDSKQFELLLKEKESHAPFEITEPNFLSSSSGSQCTIATSRTLYAGSVIVNRKIPHVNTTMARKTSFYIIGNSNEKRVIRLSNQTITLVDLCRMWVQMNGTTKLVLILFLCVFFVPLIFTYKRSF